MVFDNTEKSTKKTHPSIISSDSPSRFKVDIMASISRDGSAQPDPSQPKLEAIAEVFAALSHESRNALQRAQACLEMLRREVLDRPRALDLLGRLQKAHDALFGLYEDVRGYAAEPVGRRTRNLDQLLTEAWADVRAQVKISNVDLRSRPEFEPAAHVDGTRIAQAFRHILTLCLRACAAQEAVDYRVIDVTWQRSHMSGLPVV